MPIPVGGILQAHRKDVVPLGRRGGGRRSREWVPCPEGYPVGCNCPTCRPRGGTFNASSFRDAPQRNDSSVTNTYFNGPGDGAEHGHVKYRDNPDGTTDYLYARDVEGHEYDV